MFGQPVHEEGGEADANRHLIAVRVKNTIGALNRVANMFSARGFNLESVAVGETDEEGVARMTLATTGNDRIIAQVIRQLDGLVDTLDVEDLTNHEYVERELCLLKVRYTSENRAEIMDTLDIFRGKVVDVKPGTMTFELTGPTKKINAFLGMMRSHEIVEIARSGRVAMKRALFYGD
ncbi:MAG: acetolactate synthase small subunit [Bacteroidetes bacterium QH_8_67_23]|jgi:acetolactate synthase-1/3 small subunit|nr:MAG: acetolactate synthase small subunit [Bacteroidetes bacterium QH_8_67_23]